MNSTDVLPPTTRLLVSRGVPAPMRAALAERHDCVGADDFDGSSRNEIGLLVTTATDGADEKLMASLPRLRAICSLGVGIDALDIAAAERRGVAVSNTPDVLNDCVADLAIGLVIDVSRGLSRADRHVRHGNWVNQGPPPLGARVSGKRLGLLGFGRIARAIVQRASGFEMDVRYHTRTPKADVAWRHEAGLLDLARWADFLVVACAGGEGTRHLVNAEVLEALGPKGFLVNVARGSVVDEPALVRALAGGSIAGAALDVFACEPEVPSALLSLENVVLLPRIGSATAETRRAMGDLLLQNVESFLGRGELVTPCSRLPAQTGPGRSNPVGHSR